MRVTSGDEGSETCARPHAAAADCVPLERAFCFFERSVRLSGFVVFGEGR